MDASRLVVIPSFNTGPKLAETVRAALRAWPAVMVVVDGSTDGSADALEAAPGLRVLRRAANGGKGVAVLDGLRAAAARGVTHVLVMDADGQHGAEAIAPFMALSAADPAAMIVGVPVFDASAPRERVICRRVANGLARCLAGRTIGDCLFGFRVYPLEPLRAQMESSRHMRGFDFDAEALIRLSWEGLAAHARPVPVRYFRKDDGGVSHYRYGRDNLVLARMFARLALRRLVRAMSRTIARRQNRPAHAPLATQRGALRRMFLREGRDDRAL